MAPPPTTARASRARSAAGRRTPTTIELPIRTGVAWPNPNAAAIATAYAEPSDPAIPASEAMTGVQHGDTTKAYDAPPTKAPQNECDFGSSLPCLAQRGTPDDTIARTPCQISIALNVKYIHVDCALMRRNKPAERAINAYAHASPQAKETPTRAFCLRIPSRLILATVAIFGARQGPAEVKMPAPYASVGARGDCDAIACIKLLTGSVTVRRRY